MNPSRRRLARSSSGVAASGQARGWTDTSKSSTTSQPPGRRAPAIRRSASSRRGTWVSTSRAWTRSNRPSGGGSAATSRRSTLNVGVGRHPRDVEVGRHDPPGRPDPVGQPRRDGRPAGADLPARPPRRQPAGVEVALASTPSNVADRAPKRSPASADAVVEEVAHGPPPDPAGDPAPRLHGHRPHDHGAGIGQVAIDGGEQRVELVRRWRAGGEDAFAEAVGERQDQPPVRVPGAIDAGVGRRLHLAQPGRAQQRRQAPTDLGIEAAGVPEAAQDVAQRRPRRESRLALPAQPVDLLHDDGAARPDDPGRLAHDGDRVADVDQQQADVGDIERPRCEPGVGGVAEGEADVAEAGARAGGVVEHVAVAVEARHLPVRADAIGQQRQDPDRAAADVDHVAADRDVDAIEQRPGLVLEERCLGHQPGPFIRRVAEHVLGWCSSSSPCVH